MKLRLFLVAGMLLACTLLQAQGYQIKPTVTVPETPVKNQARTGTCWCFGTTSFLESELLRLGKGEWDLSEMYSVRNTYKDRFFDNYLRRGKGNLGPGAVCHTLTNAVANYGLLTEEAYSGIAYNSPTHNHTELAMYMEAIAKVNIELKKYSNESRILLDALLDTYLGPAPESITIEGKTMTPIEFRDYLGLNMDDYIEITSFSHHPFYTTCTVEVPDNWEYDSNYYNIPLDEMIDLMDYAINKGYSFAWDGCLDGKNFSQRIGGVAIKPETTNPKELIEILKFEAPCKEAVIDQAARQELYERFITTDDHIMHVTGLATDQNGTKYYYTKNSWSEENSIYKGHTYMSEAYVRANTISILLHKDALPKELRKKLGL